MWRYRDFILRTATPYRKYFEYEDLIIIADEGFIRAWRGWQKAYWEFEEYAAYVIRETLEAAKSLYSRNLRIESNLSLDKKLPSDNGAYGDYLAIKQDDFIYEQYFTVLFEKLEVCYRNILSLYNIGLSDKEIMQKLNISHEQLVIQKKQIGLCWMNYDENIKVRYETISEF